MLMSSCMHVATAHQTPQLRVQLAVGGSLQKMLFHSLHTICLWLRPVARGHHACSARTHARISKHKHECVHTRLQGWKVIKPSTANQPTSREHGWCTYTSMRSHTLDRKLSASIISDLAMPSALGGFPLSTSCSMVCPALSCKAKTATTLFA